MVVAANTKSKSQTVELSVPASPEYVQLVRLVLAGVGNAMSLNLEEIEDLKLAVGEACYNVFQQDPHPLDQISIRACNDGKKLVVDVIQKTERLSLPKLFEMGTSTEKSIGIILMKHLVDKVEYKSGPNGIQIRLVKHRNPA
ncbi:MAG: ATP-binding protein [Candidatus Xenobia bacterium]